MLLILGAAAHRAATLQPRGKLRLVRSAYVLAIVGGIWLWQWLAYTGSIGTYTWIQHMFTSVSWDMHYSAGRAMGVQWLIFVLTLLTPVLLIGLIAALSLHQKVPLAMGLGRGLRGVAVPTAAVLFLCYGLSLLPTAYTEAALDTAITKTVHNQPHFLAESIHKVWPGDPQP